MKGTTGPPPDTRPRGRSTATFLVTLAIASSVMTAPAAAQENRDVRVDISGRALDSVTRQPIVNAFVGIAGMRRSTYTDNSGHFTLRDVPAGRHSVVVELLGYAADTLTQAFTTATPPLEIFVAPNPIILEGLQVMNDRLVRRRRAAATSVRALDEERIRTSGAWDMRDFIRSRVFTRPCPNLLAGDTSVLRRGRVIAPSVYINEARVPGGLDFLVGYPPEEIYLVEIYSGGSHIRVYTKWYAEMLASGRARLAPVIF